MSCGWGGNRWSGVALAMRHRLQWFIHLRAHGLRQENEHPAYTRHVAWHSFTFYLRGANVHSGGFRGASVRGGQMPYIQEAGRTALLGGKIEAYRQS